MGMVGLCLSPPQCRVLSFHALLQTLALDIGFIIEDVLRTKGKLLRGLAHPAVFAARPCLLLPLRVGRPDPATSRSCVLCDRLRMCACAKPITQCAHARLRWAPPCPMLSSTWSAGWPSAGQDCKVFYPACAAQCARAQADLAHAAGPAHLAHDAQPRGLLGREVGLLTRHAQQGQIGGGREGNASFESFMSTYGAVKVGGRTFFKLMQNNEHVLLFPGGVKEVGSPCWARCMSWRC